MKNVLLVSIFLVSITCYCQKISDNNKNFSIQVSVLPSFSNFDFKGLNKTLKSNNLPQANDNLQFTPAIEIITKPFSSLKTYSSVIVGMSNSKNVLNDYTLEQRVVYSELGIGRYLIQKNRKYLFFGLAWGNVWQSVDIHKLAVSSTFNNALQEVGNSMKLESKNNQYIALNTGFDWAIDKEEDILIGIRFSYRFGFGKENWDINNRSYSDSPSSSADGLAIGVSLSIR